MWVYGIELIQLYARLIFLYGPPGTGKTSLCRALAHKTMCRYINQNRYNGGRLIEINSHSLFSKYYSESGKLVQAIFEDIIEQSQRESRVLFFVLIDEVESLVSSRMKTNDTEPLDSIRVVNTILTQIDKLKSRSNILIMTTSNLVDRIDEAFMDRADLVQHVPLPSQECRYHILCDCIHELVQKGLLEYGSNDKIDAQNVKLPFYSKSLDTEMPFKDKTDSEKVWEISGYMKGMSGRSLRKVPFQTFTALLQKYNTTKASCLFTIDSYLEAMQKHICKIDHD
jgi:SpoVK/Ycf46/Vps4 family AAA+-type ATPase